MRIAYLDCFAGISGDMFLGALVDAGVDPKAHPRSRSRIKSQRDPQDRKGRPKRDLLHKGSRLRRRNAGRRSWRSSPRPANPHPSTPPQAQHQHKIGHAHDHNHPPEHTHGRSLTVIRNLINAANLAPAVKHTAIQAFELLGASEARIHNVPIEEIHFHEVGAVDAIVDIVATSAGIHSLAIDKWFCSPLNVGGGTVDCAHGRFPVPAPATADLLRGLPTYSAHLEKELVTPTGAALVRALDPTFGPQPAMRVQQIGYGAGTRNSKDFPNVLRLSIGETNDATHSSVAVLETAIDDLSPQVLAYVTERALVLGALDVMSIAVQMKKGRLGTLLIVLADDAQVPVLEDLLLRETSTLGVRIRHERRSCLDRAHTTVVTPYGDIRIKLGSRSGEVLNAAPEFEDCRAAAAKHNVPLKFVQQAAIAAYLR